MSALRSRRLPREKVDKPLVWTASFDAEGAFKSSVKTPGSSVSVDAVTFEDLLERTRASVRDHFDSGGQPVSLVFDGNVRGAGDLKDVPLVVMKGGKAGDKYSASNLVEEPKIDAVGDTFASLVEDITSKADEAAARGVFPLYPGKKPNIRLRLETTL